MKSALQLAILAVIAFAGGFVVRGLAAPAVGEEAAPLIVTRVEGDELFVAPRLSGSVLVVLDGEEPSSDLEVLLRPMERVAVGPIFIRRGGRAIPCQPPEGGAMIPGCTPVEPPETLTLCFGGEDDGPRVCGTYQRPVPLPVPPGQAE